jgi:hypothetical protein
MTGVGTLWAVGRVSKEGVGITFAAYDNDDDDDGDDVNLNCNKRELQIMPFK